MPGCNWAKNLSFSVEPTKKTYRPIVFVIYRFTFAFFSDFYLRHGYGDQATDLPEFEL